MQNVRYAFRMLRKNLGSSLAIVVSLAIGIGANSAVFSVVNALLLRPLPYRDPGRLAAVWLHSPGIGIFRDWPSPGQYIDLQNENHSFEEMALAQSRSMTLTGRERPEKVDVLKTQSSLLHLLGAKPALGRVLLPEEDKPGKPPTAILSDAVWKRLFNSDPNIVGKGLTLDGNAYTIAGVLRPGFQLTSEVLPSEGPMDKMDIFVPLPLGADAAHNRGDENYNILVRLKKGVTVRQAQADVDVIAARIRGKDKRDRTFGMDVIGLQDQVVGDVRRVVIVILGSVALVLLIACANVANLLLARATRREKEVAIRAALGASGPQLARQLLIESVTLSLLGGLAGLALARWSLFVVHAINPGNIPRLEEVRIDWAVLAFTLATSFATGLLFGLAPVWRALRVDLNHSLKSGGRGGRTESGLRLARPGLRGLLVISELALSLMLLAGSGLLIRSFLRLQAVPTGFDAKDVLSMAVATTRPKDRDDSPVVGQRYREIESRVARLPGVQSVGFASVLPLTGSVGWGQINVEGYTPPPGQELQVDLRLASANYFRAMGIPLKNGRYFDDHDTPESRQVVIIDEKFAQRFWPRENPIGKRLWFNPMKPYVIVGVVGVVKQYGLDAETKIATYFPHQQQLSSGMYLAVRSTGNPAGLASAIVREIHAVDPDAAVYEVRTMQERLYNSLARQRFAGAMLGSFAAFALLLAALGVYGVISYLVNQSTHDIGVRVALGARPGNIVGLVVGQGMQLAAAGIVVGLVGAMALTRVMTTLLFGISAFDTVTFVSVTLILSLAAFAATAIPAGRAASADPMLALREE